MNYQRIPKNYSFLPLAAQQFGQGIEVVEQQLDKEKKQKMLDDELAQMKVDVAQVEQARQQKILEAAAEVHEAFGMEDTKEGYSRALKIAQSSFYPLTGAERKDPAAGAKRISDFENEGWQKILNRGKLDRYRRETSGTRQDVVAERLGREQSQGTVGVQEGKVKRTNAFPQTITEMQQNIGEEELRRPQVASTIYREPTAEEAYETARRIGVEGTPEAKADIGYRGRKRLGETEYPAGTTRPEVARDVIQQPVIEPAAAKYPEYFPEPEKPLTELDILKMNKLKAEAARLYKLASEGGKLEEKDLAAFQRNRNDIYAKFTTINDKLMKKDYQQDPNVRKSLESAKDELMKSLKQVDKDMATIRERLKMPEIKHEEGPSDIAKEKASNIRSGIESNPPSGFTVGIDKLGNPALIKLNWRGKVPKDKNPDAEAYRKTAAERILREAADMGYEFTGDDEEVNFLSEKLKTTTLEQIVDGILKQSKGK